MAEDMRRDIYKGSPEDLLQVIMHLALRSGPAFCRYADESANVSKAVLKRGPTGVEGHSELLAALKKSSAQLELSEDDDRLCVEYTGEDPRNQGNFADDGQRGERLCDYCREKDPKPVQGGSARRIEEQERFETCALGASSAM